MGASGRQRLRLADATRAEAYHRSVTTATDDALQAGREALSRYAWREAFDALKRADAETTLSAEDLEGLAEAAWWIGEGDIVIDARERAFSAFSRPGTGAARRTRR
jgi:hypothetical protein